MARPIIRGWLNVLALIVVSTTSLRSRAMELPDPMTFKKAPPEARIELQINGFRNGNGRVAVSIFRKEDARHFPDGDKAIDTQWIDLNGQKDITISTKELPPGEYAVAVFHDENSSGKLETNFLGIPKEGFGFSNNPTVLFGAPSFSKTSFPVTGDVARLSIRLKYFL